MRILRDDDSIEFRCDRCTGAIHAGLTTLRTEFDESAKAQDEVLERESKKPWHLCGDCMQSFYRWMQEGLDAVDAPANTARFSIN